MKLTSHYSTMHILQPYLCLPDRPRSQYNLRENLYKKTHYQKFTYLKPGIHWRQSRKDGRHSGDKNYLLSTKSTELNIFNFSDYVDRDTVDKVEQAGYSRLSTNLRQIGDKVDSRAGSGSRVSGSVIMARSGRVSSQSYILTDSVL